MSDPNALALGHFQLLSGESLLSKKRVFERAAEAMGAALDLSSETIYRALLAREKLGSTAIGEGIAIPHCRMEDCEKPCGVIVTLDEPTDFDAPDDDYVDLLFALVVPAEATQDHLNLLAGLARLFSQQDFCDALRACTTGDELYITTLERSNEDL